jgi:hypothetical protein
MATVTIKKTSAVFTILSFLATLLVIALFAGCGLSRKTAASSAQTVAASHASTIDKSLEGQTVPNVTVSGSSNVVTVAPVPLRSTTTVTDRANTEGAATDESRSLFRANVSSWFALGFALFGLAAALVAYWFWSQGTATGRAADAGIGTAIDTVASWQSRVVTEESALALADIKSSLEKQRGKIRR